MESNFKFQIAQDRANLYFINELVCIFTNCKLQFVNI